MRINFRGAPWKDVIEWYAHSAALALQSDKMPTGTLDYPNDPNYYTPAEVIDILNSFLQLKNYTLIRKGRILFVTYLPDTIPLNLLEQITPEELDLRGKYEICQCLFTLKRTTPDIIEAEIVRLLGPQGYVHQLPRSQQILITETGGKLRTIREIIRLIDDPESRISVVEVKNMSADEAVTMMRQLLSVDAADPALRAVVDTAGKKIVLSGRADMLERANDVIGRIDAAFINPNADMQGPASYKTYDATFADPTTVFAVLQTLLVGNPDTRLSLDARTGVISLYGRPGNHSTVEMAIQQMKLNAPQIDVIPLKKMTPLAAVDSIKRFYPTYSPSAAPVDPRGGQQGGQRPATAGAATPPTVEADLTARQIIVRGTLAQITEIRALLVRLGEDGVVVPQMASTTRMLPPLSPAATALVMEQLQNILPKLDSNIRVVVPVTETPQPILPEPPAIEDFNDLDDMNDLDDLIDDIFLFFPPEPPMTRWLRIADQPILAQVIVPSDLDQLPRYQPIQTPQQAAATKPQAEVVVTATPSGGIMIHSDDPEAAAKMEALIRGITEAVLSDALVLRQYDLKNSTAALVASDLQTLLGMANTSGLGVTGAGAADLSDWRLAEVLGQISVRGHSIEKTGTVTVNANERLNALLIHANAVDHKTIEGLLETLDQPNRENIANRASTRFVKLENVRAEEAKTLVDQVFANRMNRGGGAAGNLGAQQRGSQPQLPAGLQNNPQVAAMLGNAKEQLGGARGGAQAREQEPPMTVTVVNSETLAINSSEATFSEVEAFVKNIDSVAQQRTLIVVNEKLGSISPALAQQVISSMLGPSVQFSYTRAQPMQGGMGGGNLGGAMGNFGGNLGGGQRPAGAGTIGGGNFGGNNPFMNTLGGAQQRPGAGTIGGGLGGAGTIGGQQRPAGMGGAGGLGGAGTIGGQQRPAGMGGAGGGMGAMGGGQRPAGGAGTFGGATGGGAMGGQRPAGNIGGTAGGQRPAGGAIGGR
jgi:type II secretory pathway component GspD/PulD (secretin)